MIVFSGCLTGEAKKHFVKKYRILSVKIVLFSFLLLLPPIIYVANNSALHSVIHIYLMVIFIVFLFGILNKSMRTVRSDSPQKIYIKDERIICITKKCEEIRNITDVKKIYNYDEFYEIVFKFSKLSEKFICQKELLTDGSLQEFETLFKMKIVDKT